VEDRSLFHYLVDPDIKPIVHRGPKRNVRVAIAQVEWNHGPNPDPNSEFFKVLDKAGSRGPDVILMSEFAFPTDTPEAAKTFAHVAELAKKYNTYIIIGGLCDPEMPYKDGRRASWAYLWDRTGDVVGKYRIIPRPFPRSGRTSARSSLPDGDRICTARLSRKRWLAAVSLRKPARRWTNRDKKRLPKYKIP
jgi:hypothetical protein